MTAPALVVRAGPMSWRFDAGSCVLVGRGEHCDVVLSDPRVSREHLRVEYEGGWIVRDLGRVNGTWLDDQRLDRHPVTTSTRLRVGHPADGVELRLDLDPAVQRPAGRWAGGDRVLTVGRALDNDVVLNDPLVSRRHARIERTPGGQQVIDLGGPNTTLVNGVPVSGPTSLSDRDRITFGGTELVVHGDDLMPGSAERAALLVQDVALTLRRVGPLLQGVSLQARPGELVAIVGPSGAGKSTLLRVLAGELRPSGGQVRYDGYDVHDAYEAVRSRIGVVPQDDIVHARLTARQALSFAAALRLPQDTSRPERRRRVDDLLAELGLTEQAGVRVGRLSGGQRKRVSIALELLTAPSLLLLDEPTSGLDPALDRQIMARLRAIADGGRTVVVVTHNLANLEGCDRVLLLAPGGVPVTSGRPAEVLGYFGASDWADVFSRVINHPPPDGAAVHGGHAPVPARHAPTQASQPQRRGHWRTVARQCRTIGHRHVRLVLADPAYALFLFAMPVILAGLALAVPGDTGLGTPAVSAPSEPSQILVLLFIGAAFMGGAASAREIIAERAIFLRERKAGLSPRGYAAAKCLVFATICAVQSAALVACVFALKPGPAHAVLLGAATAELGLAVWFTATASCLFSLLCSALVRSTEQVMPILVVTVMAQLVLCGGMIPVTGRSGLSQLSWLAPARWGFSAGAGTVDLQALVPTMPRDPLWSPSPGWWLTCMAAPLVISVLCLVGVTVRLARISGR